MKKIISVILVLLLAFSLFSCDGMAQLPHNDSGSTADISSLGTPESGDAVSGTEADFSQTDAEMFTDRDSRTEYDESKCIVIELRGNTAAASDSSVNISGSTVTVTKEATYLVSGTLDDGMLVINAPDTAKLQIVFRDVNITSQSSAPLYIIEADKVFLTLAEGSSSILSNGGEFRAIDDNSIDSAIFSKQDLTVNGSGRLTVTSPAGHGIVSKDDLKILGSVIDVTSAAHALDANDSVRIKGAELTLKAGKDGIHAENKDDANLGYIYIDSTEAKIEAEGDGISAGSYLQINSGSFDILSGGGYENGDKESSGGWGGFPGGGGSRPPMPGERAASEEDDTSSSMKGLKAANSLLISSGTFKINSADDSIHSNIAVTINGGDFEILSGDDGIHADERLIITNGKIDIQKSYEGLEALTISYMGGNTHITASDDGINAAGGMDRSGMGGRDDMFGEPPAKPDGRAGGFGGGPGGMGGSSNGSIVISGGTLFINASGDGIDANGTLEISGGHTTVCGPTQGDTSVLDFDRTASITGGTFIGTGASNMAQTFSTSTQGVIAIRMQNQSEKTAITIKDSSGNVILSYTPELSFGLVVISKPDLKSGEKYTVTIGSITDEVTAS